MRETCVLGLLFQNYMFFVSQGYEIREATINGQNNMGIAYYMLTTFSMPSLLFNVSSLAID